jgi:hypothetical protein
MMLPVSFIKARVIKEKEPVWKKSLPPPFCTVLLDKENFVHYFITFVLPALILAGTPLQGCNNK